MPNGSFPPIPDIPYRGPCRLSQLAIAFADRAIQRPVVEMLAGDAGRPVAHGTADFKVTRRLGLRPADEMRGIVEHGAWERTE